MTFSELAVSTVILGISTQLSLQGWSRSAAAAVALSQRDEQLMQMDQQLLASRRLLQSARAVDGDCRFQAVTVHWLLDQRPEQPGLVEQRDLSADRQALWLTLSLPGDESPLRRRLFTPAGLGLCSKEVTS